jgi:hypothetical protein
MCTIFAPSRPVLSAAIVIASCVLMAITSGRLALEAAPTIPLAGLAVVGFVALASGRVPPVVVILASACLGASPRRLARTWSAQRSSVETDRHAGASVANHWCARIVGWRSKVVAPFRGRGRGTVPTIVPETRQNSVSGANTSQLDRSMKWNRVKDLRGKSKMSERRISV